MLVVLESCGVEWDDMYSRIARGVGRNCEVAVPVLEVEAHIELLNLTTTRSVCTCQLRSQFRQSPRFF